MSMPKGHKSSQGYATVSSEFGGMDYRTIAEKMTADGHKMTHATARNIFLRAMKKLAAPICDLYETESERSLDETCKDPRFQESMIDVVADIYAEDQRIDI